MLGALDAANAFDRQGGYAGYRDWRVPTIEELRTLVYCSSGQPKTWNDTGKPCEGYYESPTIYQSAFPNTSGWFWSSSTSDPNDDGVWSVTFGNGYNYDNYTGSYGGAVRLVRGGQ